MRKLIFSPKKDKLKINSFLKIKNQSKSLRKDTLLPYVEE